MKRALSIALALLLLLAACGREQHREEAEYVLYFLADDGSLHGSALGTQPYGTGEDEAPDAGELLRALLAGPTQEGLRSPFPKGLTLQGWEEDPEQPDHLRVRLSEQYSGLTDISLTLADYCVVLTLSQLEGVESVEITSEGHSANFRSHQLLKAEEAVLQDQTADAPEENG